MLDMTPRPAKLQTRSVARHFALCALMAGAPCAGIVMGMSLVAAMLSPLPGVTSGWLIDAVAAALVGLFVTTLGGSVQWMRSRAVARVFGHPLGRWEVLRAAQTSQVVVDRDPAEARDLACWALRQLNPRQLDESAADGAVRAVTRWSAWSMGENVEALIERLDDRRSVIYLSSRPRRGATILADGAQNLENVSRLSAFLREFEQRAPRAASRLP
jgi:hypothetical protein